MFDVKSLMQIVNICVSSWCIIKICEFFIINGMLLKLKVYV